MRTCHVFRLSPVSAGISLIFGVAVYGEGAGAPSSPTGSRYGGRDLTEPSESAIAKPGHQVIIALFMFPGCFLPS